jgi:hypothetical protein
MAIALVNQTSKGGSTNQVVTTNPVNMLGANFLVLNVGYYAGGSPTIATTDDQLNTWLPLTARVAGGTFAANQLFYCPSPVVSATQVFQVQDLGIAIYPAIQVLGFSGVHASPLDQQTGATGGTQSTLSPGSLTPSEDNCLVIAGLGHEINTGGAVSINGGFSSLAEAYVGSVSEGAAIGWLIQTTAALASPTWNTTNNATGIAASLATFKAAVSASGLTLVGRTVLDYGAD